MTFTDLMTPDFRSAFTGELLLPDDGSYDTARAVWNGAVDLRPAVIARCHEVSDVVAAVNLAREANLTLAIRAGGHSVAGLSSCDGGIVIDLTAMRGVTVDVVRSVAIVEPGAQWCDLDAATAEHGLATTGGLISSTGVAGLTLGGGIGWLQRKFGLSCDNLVAAEVVTAAGEVITCSEDQRPELLWALRGGGGNFGVVTRFELTLHPVSTILGGMAMWPLDRAREVIAVFNEVIRELPDEGSLLLALVTAPPEPFVPLDLVGRPAIIVLGCWCGDLDVGTENLKPLRDLAPAVDVFGPLPYPALQAMLDGGARHGLRNYFRSGFTDELCDDLVDALIDHAARMPSPMSQIHFHQMGGAVDRVEGGAFSGRGAGFTYNLISTWVDPEEDAIHIEANRALAAALAPFSGGRNYINFITEADSAKVRVAYGDDRYERLARVKKDYDPQNLFHRNHNIEPAS